MTSAAPDLLSSHKVLPLQAAGTEWMYQ